MPDPQAQRGPLHDLHTRLGARFVPFSGFEMPVMYSSIKAEHQRVREAVGLFDVSHMSNLRITGPGAEALISRCTVTDASAIAEGRGAYTVILDDDGHILDDTIVYRLAPDAFYMVPNAGMNERIAHWLDQHADALEDEVTVQDESRTSCIFALQGPHAAAVLEALGAAVTESPRFAAHEVVLAGAKVLVTTTGYTGETGYELFLPASDGPRVFEALLEAGQGQTILPCGLGARDTLRLEMGFALAGHEFKGGRTPLEAKLAWTIKWDHDFIGKEALLALKEEGDYDRLVGLEMTGRGIPREDHPVLDAEGDGRIGVVTSGTQSPTLGKGIALAYVTPEHAKAGTKVQVEVRGKGVDAVVVKTPFLKR